MLIHEIRRSATEAPVHTFKGHELKFKANEAGDVVCDVPDEIAEELLAVVGSAMQRYAGSVVVAAAVQKPTSMNTADTGTKSTPGGTGGGEGSDGGAEASKFVITSPDDKTFDLGKMTDDEVRAFAKTAGLKAPHHTKRGDALRQLVIDGLKAAD